MEACLFWNSIWYDNLLNNVERLPMYFKNRQMGTSYQVHFHLYQIAVTNVFAALGDPALDPYPLRLSRNPKAVFYGEYDNPNDAIWLLTKYQIKNFVYFDKWPLDRIGFHISRSVDWIKGLIN